MKKILFALVLAGICWPVSAEKIHLDIYARRFDSIPIGIVDFKAKTAKVLKSDLPWKVLANDFDLSARSVVLGR